MKKLTVIMMATVLLGAMMVPGTAVAQPYLSVGDLNSGELVITEIMQNPSAVSDTYGEWFEVLNKSGETVDLEGLEIRDTGTNVTTIDSSVVIADGYYAVLGRNADTSLNGGVALDYDYGSFWLEHDNADEIILQVTLDSGTVKEIDRVAYDNGATFPDPTGASMALDPAKLNATANDIGANWAVATCPYGDGDYGTPGYANSSCNHDLDGDGFDCLGSGGSDCDDTRPSVHPGATEICGNDRDDNCVGGVDEEGCSEPEAAVPELTTILLMSLGLLGLGGFIVIKRRRAGTAVNT